MALLSQIAICTKRKSSNDEKAKEMLRLAREVQPLFKGLGEKRGMAKALRWVGVAFGMMQKYQDAAAATGESKDLFKSAGDSMLEASEAQLLALWHLKEQDSAQAVRAAAEALRLLKALGSHGEKEASMTQ